MLEHTNVERISPITEFQQPDDCQLRRQPYLLKRSLRSILFCALTGVLVAGCVPSLHPFYKQGQGIFDKELVGAWDPKAAPSPDVGSSPATLMKRPIGWNTPPMTRQTCSVCACSRSATEDIWICRCPGRTKTSTDSVILRRHICCSFILSPNSA